MRLGDDLKVVYDIQEKNFFLPPLTLQPLVENAVKHGLFYKAGGGTVMIQSRREKGKIILSVQDDGLGFEIAAREEDFSQRKHHGLENVRSRVEKMMGGTLHIDSHPDQGSIVTLEFPVEGQV
jgi:sensor histidine kinase YesM